RPPRCPLGRPRLMPTARRVWWIPCRSLPQLLWGLPGRPLALPGLPLVVRRRPPCRLVSLRIVLLWPRSVRGPLKLLPRRLPVVPSRRGSLLAVRSLALLGLLRVSRRRRLLLRLLGVARRRRALMPTARSPWWIPYRGMMTVSLWRARPPPRCVARRAIGASRASLALPRGTLSAGSLRRTRRRLTSTRCPTSPTCRRSTHRSLIRTMWAALMAWLTIWRRCGQWRRPAPW